MIEKFTNLGNADFSAQISENEDTSECGVSNTQLNWSEVITAILFFW